MLKGRPVQFQITIVNQGDGPARNVTVQAKLSPGLRHESGEPADQNLFEQTLDVVNPHQRIVLETLMADTTQGGEQSCVVLAQSPDVVPGSEDAKSVKTLEVIEPKLVLTMSGSEKRYTGTSATYEIKLRNNGTAPAKNIKVVSTLPTSARLLKAAGAKWDSQARKLVWTKTSIEPGQEETLSYNVGLGGPGLYPFAAEARGDGAIYEKNTLTTDVLAVADIRIEVSESRRVVDVGENTILSIAISNKGTKAATKILVRAKLSDTIEPTNVAGVDEDGNFDRRPDQRLAVFPLIERLEPGKEIKLQIAVKAVKAGLADCRVYLTHADPADEKLDVQLDDFTTFKVTEVRK